MTRELAIQPKTRDLAGPEPAPPSLPFPLPAAFPPAFTLPPLPRCPASSRSTLLEGPEYVDVPALSSKDYKLAVHCFTTAPTAASVTFRNEASGEYSFYELKYTAGAPPPRGTLSLECPVRTQTTAKVGGEECGGRGSAVQAWITWLLEVGGGM